MEKDRRRTILVVDDAFANRALLNKTFSGEFRVELAENGLVALDKLKRLDNVAAVILDIVMPELDGYGVLERMQADTSMFDIPVVVVTANSDEESQIRALDRGAIDVIVKPFSPQVVLHRVRNIIERKDAERLAEQNRLYEQRIWQSETDEKSGIFNRQGFRLRTEALLRENPDKQYVLVRWDVDRFKVFRDAFGMAASDAYMEGVGAAYRKYATSGMTYGRLEADHFACCIEYRLLDVEKVSTGIDKLVARLHPGFEFVTRIGFYIIDDSTIDVELMCDRALLALHSIKGSYSRRYAFYDASMRAALIEEQEMIGEMQTALEQNQFVVHLQPQYNYADGSLHGAEALVRWQHPEKGFIMPDKFIPIFEKNGFISRLDEWVWEQACKLLRRWLDAGYPVVPISVNVSRQDVYNPNLSKQLADMVCRYGLDPTFLRLEITESSYMDNPQQLIKVVEQLQNSGFFVEMDDFGSGYSSLNLLKDVPVDLLKLDMKFLQAHEQGSERSGSILSAIVRMANMINLPVLAEGVETKQQADFLKSIACFFMQGYYFYKPMPVESFEKLLCTEGMPDEAKPIEGTSVGEIDFLNSASQEALIFNSFVGGAGILNIPTETLQPCV